jgi:hypothetical protein
MLYSKISAVSVVDKWAPHSIKLPQFKAWDSLIN